MDAYDASPPRRSPRGADPLDQRLDRWVSTGRQFVDGVVGARPGSRPAPRPGERPGERRGAGRPSLDGLGRWVEDRLDWLLEDGDDWREPWQEAPSPRRRAGPGEAPDQSRPAAVPSQPPLATGRSRRGLEAVSRRGPASLPPRSPAAPASPPAPAAPAAGLADGDWPDEATFSVPRWQRPALAATPPPFQEAPGPEGNVPGAAASPQPPPRPLPRSSRRR